MKTILIFAICGAMAAPILCQSTSAPTGQQEKEQQLRTALPGWGDLGVIRQLKSDRPLVSVVHCSAMDQTAQS